MLCIDSTKPFLPSTLVECVQILSGLSILFAAGTYYFNRKLKRAEWLKSLYEKFYENNFYKEIRKWVDWNNIQDEIENNDDYHTKQEKFDDFLNFFEFIAILEGEKQIKLDEIEKMFAYYLGRIYYSIYCKDYIRDNGYENLEKLLAKMDKNKLLHETKKK